MNTIQKELRIGMTYFNGEAVDVGDIMDEAADRIDLLEKLVLQYRNDLSHPVDAEKLESRLADINEAMAETWKDFKG
jgi:hypothetical protein|tara:strand:- start:3166 stop:3396 length:231 start_codon:yes stop_codon:yes gene_type:complete